MALHDTRVLPCAQFPSVDAAIAAYLAEVNIPPPRGRLWHRQPGHGR